MGGRDILHLHDNKRHHNELPHHIFTSNIIFIIASLAQVTICRIIIPRLSPQSRQINVSRLKQSSHKYDSSKYVSSDTFHVLRDICHKCIFPLSSFVLLLILPLLSASSDRVFYRQSHKLCPQKIGAPCNLIRYSILYSGISL